MTTDNTKQTLAANIARNKAELTAMFGMLDVAVKMMKDQDNLENDCVRTVLADNEFFFAEDNVRAKAVKGERITDPELSFLIPEGDKDRFYEKFRQETSRRGIVDENGKYVVNTLKTVAEAKRTLALFIFENVLPEEMRDSFRVALVNVVYTDKLLDIIRKAIS